MRSPSIAPGTLVLLVGPAGAGKSTWAARSATPTRVLSSDAFRAMVADDPADLEATADAFRLLHAVVRARLRRGLTTIIDATNLTPGAQRPLLSFAGRHGRPVLAVAFDVPLERCLSQNRARSGRVVPDAIVRQHHRLLPAALDALRAAGVPIIDSETGRPR